MKNFTLFFAWVLMKDAVRRAQRRVREGTPAAILKKSESDRRYYEKHSLELKARQREYYRDHKAEVIAYNRKWDKENSERRKKTHRVWENKNIEYLRESKRRWASENPEKRRAASSKFYHKKKADPSFRLAMNFRHRVWLALRGLSSLKGKLGLLGCSVEALREYLESKFQLGMSWENYGRWHVDHILPCASFDLTDAVQQKVCFHYTNLQPLWAVDNFSKGAKCGH